MYLFFKSINFINKFLGLLDFLQVLINYFLCSLINIFLDLKNNRLLFFFIFLNFLVHFYKIAGFFFRYIVVYKIYTTTIIFFSFFNIFYLLYQSFIIYFKLISKIIYYLLFYKVFLGLNYLDWLFLVTKFIFYTNKNIFIAYNTEIKNIYIIEKFH